MSKNKIELLFGLILIAMPFSGFPPAWKTFVFVAMGVWLILIAFTAHLRRKSWPLVVKHKEVVTEVYSESGINGKA